ncbi:MAG: hypothetical protein ABW124_21940 [Candidatus Thiodiazotropha sp. 6PLUC9]
MKTSKNIILLSTILVTAPVFAQEISCSETLNKSSKKLNDFSQAIACLESRKKRPVKSFPVGSILYSTINETPN